MNAEFELVLSTERLTSVIIVRSTSAFQSIALLQVQLGSIKSTIMAVSRGVFPISSALHAPCHTLAVVEGLPQEADKHPRAACCSFSPLINDICRPVDKILEAKLHKEYVEA